MTGDVRSAAAAVAQAAVAKARELPKWSRLNLAMVAARELYPAPVAKILVQEIGAYGDHGYRFGPRAPNALVDHLVEEKARRDFAANKPRLVSVPATAAPEVGA